MRIFAANCSQQHQIASYTMLESLKTITSHIGLGTQQHIGKADMNQQEVDYILSQLTPYGWVHINDIKTLMGTRLLPIVYSIDKPVSLSDMNKVINHNRGLLTKTGEQMRKDAAVDAHHVLSQGDREAADTMELTIREATAGDVPHDGTNETIAVARPGDNKIQSRADRRRNNR